MVRVPLRGIDTWWLESELACLSLLELRMPRLPAVDSWLATAGYLLYLLRSINMLYVFGGLFYASVAMRLLNDICHWISALLMLFLIDPNP